MVPPYTHLSPDASSMAQLVALVTDQNPNIVREGTTDAQAQTLALNLGQILSPDQVFAIADLEAWATTWATGNGYVKP